MKRHNSKLVLVLLTLCMILAAAISMPNVQAASKLKLNKTSVTLEKGESVTLKLKGTKKKVTWSSNKKKVATVTKKGKVTAKKVGTAKITAKVGKKKYTCKVKVVKAQEQKSSEPTSIPESDPNQPVTLDETNCQYSVYNGEVTIHNYAYDKEWTSIIIPSTLAGYPVKTVGSFCNHKKLVKVVISGGVTRIEEGAFQGCTNLTQLVIPDSIIDIAGRTPGYIIGDEFIPLGTMPDGSVFGFTKHHNYQSVFGECPNLTIYGKPGSLIEEVANKEGLPFKLIE